MPIPRNIFQVWFQGADNIKNPSFEQNILNWKLLNPGWDYKLIADQQLRNACRQYSDECVRTYDSFQLLHQKVDFGRYVLMWLHGGLYVDMDMFAFRSLDKNKKIAKLVDEEDCDVICLSKLNISNNEAFLFGGMSFILNNAMMLASKQNPMILRLIEEIISITKTGTQWNSDYATIHHTTGHKTIQNVFAKSQHVGKVIFLPPQYFEPCYIDGSNVVRDETIALHCHAMTWVSRPIQTLVKGYYYIKSHALLILILLVIISFLVRKCKTHKN